VYAQLSVFCNNLRIHFHQQLVVAKYSLQHANNCYKKGAFGAAVSQVANNQHPSLQVDRVKNGE
jgi:hypothetical protein